MGKRTGLATKDFLIAAALPEQTETYTVISHELAINKTLETLLAKGFDIRQEFYRCNNNATMAQGIYHLNHGQDPDMGMMFAWVNSYDKTLRFRCTIGGYLYISNNRLISGEKSTWGRKHTGSADQEVLDTINDQFAKADSLFTSLIYDKEEMKKLSLTDKDKAEFMGRLYFIDELITSEQLSVVKEQLKKPAFDYGVPQNNLWAFYNAILCSLQKGNPRAWMEQQRLIHLMITDTFGIKPFILSQAEQELIAGTDPVDNTKPKVYQTRLDDAIEEVEQVNAARMAIEIPEEVQTLDPVIVQHEEQEQEEAKMVETLYEKQEVDPGEVPWKDEVSDPVPMEQVSEVDEGSWPCVCCGKMQPPAAVFYEGQLCGDCYNKQDSMEIPIYRFVVAPHPEEAEYYEITVYPETTNDPVSMSSPGVFKVLSELGIGSESSAHTFDYWIKDPNYGKKKLADIVNFIKSAGWLYDPSILLI